MTITTLGELWDDRIADEATRNLISPNLPRARKLAEPRMGGPSRPLAKLQPEDVVRMRKRLAAEGYSKRSLKRAEDSTMKLLKYAHYLGLVSDSLMLRLANRPKIGNTGTPARHIEPVKWELVNATIDAARADRNWQLATIIEVHSLIGCRVAEVCRMAWADIDDERESETGCWYWECHDHKRARFGKRLIYVLGPRVQVILRERRERQGNISRWVFQSRINADIHIRPLALSHKITKLCLKHGIEPWNPRQIRHSRATQLSHEMGAEAESASLGHSMAIAEKHYVEQHVLLAEEVAKRFG